MDVVRSALAVLLVACGPAVGPSVSGASTSDANAATTTSSDLPPDLASTESSDASDGGSVDPECGAGVHEGHLEITDATSAEQTAGITHVRGDLLVEGTAALEDLSLLSEIRCVDGAVQIMANEELRSLDGLENLRTIGDRLWVIGNSSLESAGALGGVRRIGALDISANPALIELPRLADGIVFAAPMTGVEVGQNRVEDLEQLFGLSHVAIEAELLTLTIYLDDTLRSADFTVFAGTEVPTQVYLTKYAGDGAALETADLAGFEELDMLVVQGASPVFRNLHVPTLRRARRIAILGDHGLTDLTALSELEEVSESLQVGCQTAGVGGLVSLAGLEAIESIPELVLDGLPDLTSLDGLSATLVVDRLEIAENPALPTEVAEALAVQVSAAEVEICGNAGGRPCRASKCTPGMGD